MNKKCLNCSAEIENNYCSVCGQKTSTERFSFKYVLKHDFIHGVFLLDKGFLYTLKALFTKPGLKIREYIQGKRVEHFNYFALLIILLSVNFFLSKYRLIDPIELYGKENTSGYLKLSKDYGKILNVLGIPFWAGVLYLLFKKSKQNYTENIIISVYMMCAILTLNLPYATISIFTDEVSLLLMINNIKGLAILAYMFYFIYQYFSVYQYSKISLITRTLTAIVVIAIIENLVTKAINLAGTMLL